MNNCGSCSLYQRPNLICARTGLPQSPDDYCSSFTTYLNICGLCGRPYLPPTTYIIENEKIIPACASCAANLSTCGTCSSASYCDFQQNPNPLPQMIIQQQIQKGAMTMTQTIPNPARIVETCEKNCSCWDATDKVCNRQTAYTCGNYKIKER